MFNTTSYFLSRRFRNSRQHHSTNCALCMVVVIFFTECPQLVRPQDFLFCLISDVKVLPLEGIFKALLRVNDHPKFSLLPQKPRF